MTSAERIDVAIAVDHLRAAERRLADAIAFGDAHEACVEALALIRAAIGPNSETSENTIAEPRSKEKELI